MHHIGYRVDFLPVGNGDKSGDAIAIRLETRDGVKVVVVDGGTQESGAALVDHIRSEFRTDRVDHLVNTHPDADHASGLSQVIEGLKVDRVWMHRPWLYARTPETRRRVKEQFRHVAALEGLAHKQATPISEPFAGQRIGPFVVLSPSRKFYGKLLPDMLDTEPDSLQNLRDLAKSILAKSETKSIHETWTIETLPDFAETSPRNESSVILYGVLCGQGILLTGDAGPKALQASIDEASRLGIALNKCSLSQIPHHGSKHNVTPTILDFLVGPRTPIRRPAHLTAIVSASSESAIHPRRVVTNAYMRRGAEVHTTKGQVFSHSLNTHTADYWSPSVPTVFSNRVESA